MLLRQHASCFVRRADTSELVAVLGTELLADEREHRSVALRSRSGEVNLGPLEGVDDLGRPARPVETRVERRGEEKQRDELVELE